MDPIRFCEPTALAAGPVYELAEHAPDVSAPDVSRRLMLARLTFIIETLGK